MASEEDMSIQPTKRQISDESPRQAADHVGRILGTDIGPEMETARPRVRLIITDFDGVHTDNRVFVFQDGTEAVVCNRADGLACSLLADYGVRVIILSTEVNPVVAERAAKISATCVQACADKGEAVVGILSDHTLLPSEVVYVGNDINDLSGMREVHWRVIPADAHSSLFAIATYVTARRGGEGVLRELFDVTLEGSVPWRF